MKHFESYMPLFFLQTSIAELMEKMLSCEVHFVRCGFYHVAQIRYGTVRNGTVRNGTKRNGTKRNGTQLDGTGRDETKRNGHSQRFLLSGREAT